MFLLKNKILFILLFLLVLITGCGDQEFKEEDTSEFDKLEWMLGIWEGKQGDAEIYESWRKKNFRIMEGISYTTMNEKRVYAQTMRIEQSNNIIFLIIKFNQGDENNFRLKEIDENKVVFENSLNTFPKTIVYENPKQKTMQVSVEGEGEGTQKYTYKRTRDV